MSADYYIYTDHIDEFDRDDFEHWAREQGYEVLLHPEFSIRDEGFSPLSFRAAFLGDGSWQTGFELFSSANDSEDLTYIPVEPPMPKKQGFFARLFGKKAHNPMPQPPVCKSEPMVGEPSPFEQAVAGKKWVITLSCFAREPLEMLSVYLFAGYFCQRFGAVVDDPQLGRYYDNAGEIMAVMEAIQADMLENYKSWGLEFIPFTGWEQK